MDKNNGREVILVDGTTINISLFSGLKAILKRWLL